MSVVMSGQYSYWLNFYNRTQKAVELVSNDLNSTVARAGLDKGEYAVSEGGIASQGKPLFVATDRTDANNPTYKITDDAGSVMPAYTVDSNGNILYKPASIAVAAAPLAAPNAIGPGWYNGNWPGTTRTVPFGNNAYIWHPNTYSSYEQIHFGRSFMLDRVDPQSSVTQRGGTVYLTADNGAQVYVNDTFIGETSSTGGAYQQPVELVIPPGLLKQGENTITVQASDSGAPAGLNLVADIGGIDGRGSGFGGVTMTTQPNELDRWSVSKRNEAGLMGKVAFEVRQGSALTTRTDQISRMGAVLQTLSGMLGAAADQDQSKFKALK